MPLSAKVPHEYEIAKVDEFTTHRVRPTSGAEFIYSRHFPDEFRGDLLINNTIGFLGNKQHKVWEDEDGGFTGELRQDIVYSKDPNYRPVDLEFAPDGSLYIVDWQDIQIGFLALNKQGEFGSYCIQPSFQYAVYDPKNGNQLIDGKSKL